jgi:hypothetical protein
MNEMKDANMLFNQSSFLGKSKTLVEYLFVINSLSYN